ncbi:unnamed protein product [Cyprideis torosa]|uniref:Uncharacterized protein n=1 Tax=Cyprideis torosa TaxID=163714 RepID=A0A7R8WM75_9CRUS|nr:unnamed protein product [Cyprideis torosa]CAG0905015.1 unnamed protein product [Cyprideis torosa]
MLVEFKTLEELVDATAFLKNDDPTSLGSLWTAFEWIDVSNERSIPIICEIPSNPPPWNWPAPMACFCSSKAAMPCLKDRTLDWDAA